MRLSRLSDRQLRRLIRNADVRFGDETVGQVFEEMAKAAFAMQKKLFEAQTVGEKVFKIAHKLPPEYEKELKGFNEMWNKFFYYALANIGYRAGDFKDAARKYKDTPIK